MKAFVLLVATCLVACAYAVPSGRRDSSEDNFDDYIDDGWPYFRETLNALREQMLQWFWNVPDFTNMPIPEGANTTSTVKVVDGHMVTINETTYSSGDKNGGTAFRIRIIDVKPLNDTLPPVGSDANTTPGTTSPQNPESAETVEDFNNEISKNGGDTLNA
ncbi:PREDICTED: icarapin-like [Dinoponera quadriceps]|uniref:Icarapin-like n=1 Tax=Dinoponera quadriceps TaxID=609295 RepID=A0A6P3XMN5_DINQU|nr:PREDICTED: icarapin-like [Dinoponera quadriceps]